MIESKPWDWKVLKNSNDRKQWLEPSIESYFLIHRWKEQNKKDFLDIGCGLGRHTIQFAKADFKVTAIDLSKEALNYLENRAAEEKLSICIQHEDFEKMNFPESSFDCILCRNVISHTDTEGICRILELIYHILRPGGECFLTLGSKKSDVFLNKKNKFVDSNTKIRLDKGPEYGVPHFYADTKMLPELFKKFQIEKISLVNDLKIENDKFKNCWHYYILVKK